MILTADRVVLPAGLVEPGWVETSGDRVTGAGGGTPPAPADRHLRRDPRPRLRRPALPRRWGCGVHHRRPRRGGDGASRPTAPTAPPRSSPASSPTPRSASSRLVRALAPLVRSRRAGRHPPRGAVAQRRALRRPRPGAAARARPAEVARLLDAGDGTVRMVTLAPELDTGSTPSRLLSRRGVDRGPGPHRRPLRHLTRGDRGRRHGRHAPVQRDAPGAPPRARAGARADGGPEGRASRLIADGVHLHPEVLRWVADVGTAALRPGHRRHGRRRGGATATTCSGPAAVEVRDGVARLVSNGAIAGSTLTMDRAVRYAVTRRRGSARRPPSRRPRRRRRACSGLTDVGALEAGRRADLVHLDEELEVRR